MRVKQGVRLENIDWNRLWPIFVHAKTIWRSHGQELVITSGTEGTHSKNSLHYRGLALDLRTRYFTEDEKHRVYLDLQRHLDYKYRVFKEPTHIHVEYRPNDNIN